MVAAAFAGMVVGVVLSVGAGIFYLATAAAADNVVETLDANRRFGCPALAMATAGIFDGHCLCGWRWPSPEDCAPIETVREGSELVMGEQG
jgi:hypothetical protein